VRAVVICDVLTVELDGTNGGIAIGTTAKLEKNLVSETWRGGVFVQISRSSSGNWKVSSLGASPI